MIMMINKCLGAKNGRDVKRFLWNLVRVDRIEALGICFFFFLNWENRVGK